MSGWYDANLVLIQATFVNLLLALSLQVPFRFGVFSFSGIGCYGIGAYTAAILTIHQNTSAIVSIVAAALIGGVVSYLLALLVARLGGLYLAMATISFTLIIGVVAINGGDLTGGVTGLFGVLADLPMSLIVAIPVVVVLLLAMSERGAMGRRIEAVREDPELAASTGTNVRRYREAAFVVSGLVGGAAGALNVLIRTTIGPSDIYFPLIVLALTMIIIGGTRSWAGALIGSVIFTWLPSTLEWLGEWQHLVYGLLVVFAAVFIPGGLVGVMTDSWRAVKRRRRGPVVAPAIEEAEVPPQEEAEELVQLQALGQGSGSQGSAS